jgi:hypothetical protein
MVWHKIKKTHEILLLVYIVNSYIVEDCSIFDTPCQTSYKKAPKIGREKETKGKDQNLGK